MRREPDRHHNFRPTIEMLGVDCLRDNPRNPKRHKRKQIVQIKHSIGEYGFTNPVLIDANGMIVAGHARVRAAKELGYMELPCIRLEHLSADEIRALAIADNRHSDNADYDYAMLAQELSELLAVSPDLNIEALGFTIVDIDTLFADQIEAVDFEPEPVIPQCGMAEIDNPVPGEIWQQGDRRIVCGDAADRVMIAALLDGNETEMIFTDPPYTMSIKLNGVRKGRSQKQLSLVNDKPVQIACGWPRRPFVDGAGHD